MERGGSSTKIWRGLKKRLRAKDLVLSSSVKSPEICWHHMKLALRPKAPRLRWNRSPAWVWLGFFFFQGLWERFPFHLLSKQDSSKIFPLSDSQICRRWWGPLGAGWCLKERFASLLAASGPQTRAAFPGSKKREPGDVLLRAWFALRCPAGIRSSRRDLRCTEQISGVFSNALLIRPEELSELIAQSSC